MTGPSDLNPRELRVLEAVIQPRKDLAHADEIGTDPGDGNCQHAGVPAYEARYSSSSGGWIPVEPASLG